MVTTSHIFSVLRAASAIGEFAKELRILLENESAQIDEDRKPHKRVNRKKKRQY